MKPVRYVDSDLDDYPCHRFLAFFKFSRFILLFMIIILLNLYLYIGRSRWFGGKDALGNGNLSKSQA
jgi:hypothetical protein